jgi:hypothetical protein
MICCGAFVIATTWSTAKSSQTDNHSKAIPDEISELKRSLKVENIKVTNRVKSISVVSIEKNSGNTSIVISLKNNSDKKITAYMVAAGESLTFTDYAFSEEDGILSQGIIKVHEGIRIVYLKDKSPHISPDLRNKGIAVLAVIFEDGTTEGAPDSVKNLIQYRLGGKSQVEQTISNLEAVKDLSESNQLTKFEQLKSVMRTSLKQQENTLSYFRFGTKDVQDTFLMEIERPKNNASKEVKSRIADLIERYKRIKSKCILLY